MFLDTHPNNCDAARKLEEYRRQLAQLTKEFEEKYGPIGETPRNTSRWAWISDSALRSSFRSAMVYLSQRYSMPYPELRAILTDIGTEELAHLEMICAIIYQLTKNMKPEEAKACGFDAYYL